VRLLAPVLPVTADELWRHMPGKREASVHLAEFPEPAEVAAMMDQDLVARWERLIRVRNVVNAALEAKRQDKTIGTSLGARVAVRTSGETAALLERYRDDLPMLFIVSDVALESGPGGDDTLEVGVERAEGQKCARCWRVVPQVSSSPGTEGLCDRCLAAITGT
jgi:isoleucyl-tRNA synthetase